MDILGRMNEAMSYIEQHLTEKIDNQQLARITGCSTYHFTRMFSFIAGVPLSEYIRRRRLTAAAFDLQSSKDKIIDLALKYGYDSPTSFNRAFQHLHGVSPKAARERGVKLKSYPVMSFHLSIKGDVQMNYKIIEQGEMLLVGIKKNLALLNGDEDFEAISKMWAGLTEEKADEIMALSNGAIQGLIGVSANNDGETVDYYIACTTDASSTSDMDTLLIPATTWGVFESIGPLPEALVNTWKRIFSEWFPSSGYQCAELPTLEIYEDGDNRAEEYRCELWIPIAKI